MKPCDIAIVGMACLYPNAPDLQAYWQNIVRGVDCLRDADEREWESKLYYDKQSKSFDKIYCRRGGFITELAEFDPLKFGIMPNGIAGADPDQFLALKVASEALADAGYTKESFNGDRAEVIIGRVSAPGAGAMNMIQHGTTVTQTLEVLKKLQPQYTEEQLGIIADALRKSLLPSGADTIPGVMPNVLAGRIAGKLNCRGRSLLVDAACASSLIALEIGVQDLKSGMCDVVLAGGIHVNSFAVFYQMFCGIGALSRAETIRPFDDSADGTLLGEGVGVVVLKRLEDAVKNKDRIYAVIKGIGSSSDGYGTSMLAPSEDGESLAMRRAYDMAGFSPRTVQLLEAHGTGTAAGDVTEMHAVQKVFQSDDQHRQWCAVGSVKSNIGHTQAASGVAGLIKAALALYQKILPPTINVQTPSKQIDWSNSPCYINKRARLWVHPQVHAKVEREKYPMLAEDGHPRRAAVSAFGFGGVNAHAVLEEYQEAAESDSASLLPAWDSEVCLFVAPSRAALESKLISVHAYITALMDGQPSGSIGRQRALKDIAYTLSEDFRELDAANEQERAGQIASPSKLAIVAGSVEELAAKIELVLQSLRESQAPVSALSIQDPDIFLPGNDEVKKGRLAFVLPGLGAAYPNMLADLSAHLPDVRAVFDFVDHIALTSGAAELPSEKIFPNPFKTSGNRESSIALLANEDSAVVMLLLAEWALYTVLTELGLKPDALVGVSTGEFAVLNISGASDIIESAPLFYKFSTAVARSVPKDGLKDLRTIKIDGDWKDVEPILANITPPVYLSAALSAKQCLLSGDKSSIAEAQLRIKSAGIVSHMLPIAIPYHTPLVAGHIQADNEELNRLPIHAPRMEAWSCSIGDTYPDDADKIKEITTNLFTRPIRLQETIDRMYKQGVRKFIEVGPKGTLVNVISEILEGRPHLVLASNRSTVSAMSQLNQMIAALACHDVPLDLRYLYKRRSPRRLDLSSLPPRPAKSMKLSLTYPELRLNDNLPESLRGKLAEGAQQVDNFQATASPPAICVNSLALEQSTQPQLVPPQWAEQQLAQQQLQQQVLHEQVAQPVISGSFFANGKTSLLNAGLISCNATENQFEANLSLNIFEHQYLQSHAIGGTVSRAYGDERVFLLPLTAALEMMAEAASCLAPGLVPIKLENIRAIKRIRAGFSGTVLNVMARRKKGAPDRFEACLRLVQDPQLDENLDAAAMSCDILFASQVPAAKKSVALQELIPDGRPPHLSPEHLYTPSTMFHGPLMQCVSRLEKLNKKQILARVTARDALGWLPTLPTAQFLLNPLLLDNITQPVLFHLYEHGQSANALLPFFVDSLEVFADLDALRGEFFVHATLNSMTNRGTEADVALIGADGTVLAQFNNICSRRIVVTEPWRSHISNPEQSFFGQFASATGLPDSPFWTSCSFDLGILPEEEVTLTWLLDYLLNPQEQRYVEQAITNGARRREWVLGRIAAKEAVRKLLMQLHGISIPLADIIIGRYENGKPWVCGEFVNYLGWTPLISVSHKGGKAIATAAHPQAGASIGIDVELVQVKDDGFERLAFTDLEREILAGVPAPLKPTASSAIWAAKEAAAKASGLGLRNNPKSIQIHALPDASGNLAYGLTWQAELMDAGTAFNTVLPVSVFPGQQEVFAMSFVPLMEVQPAATIAY